MTDAERDAEFQASLAAFLVAGLKVVPVLAPYCESPWPEPEEAKTDDP